MKIIVTGGAGFIGSAVIRHLLSSTKHKVINVDCLTYAGNLDSLSSIADSNNYSHELLDICDQTGILDLLNTLKPDAIMHLAAESHVDRSITGPDTFMQTNIIGTYSLLEATRKYLHTLQDNSIKPFIFHHVSTDEVFGDLGAGSVDTFCESSNYEPSSPYAASKASSDHLVRAWGRTFGLPYVISNCSNNYGPYQFPEKLIPHMILNCLQGKDLNIYGDGGQIRDWLYVDDHAEALINVMLNGVNGETYNIGGNNEKTNLEVVTIICKILDELRPSTVPELESYVKLIKFVTDRPGHDHRYAINACKIRNKLSWEPRENFDSGIRKTIEWYLRNSNWTDNILSGEYALDRKGLIQP